jgi:hypothetical protein
MVLLGLIIGNLLIIIGAICSYWGNLDLAKSLQPSENGAPGGIRTPDQEVRSLLLYPAELRVRYSTQNM